MHAALRADQRRGWTVERIPQRRQPTGIASMLATVTVATFMSTTVAVEQFGDEASIRAAKQAIVFGLILLVPSMAAAALTGRRLAGRSRAPAVLRKLRRMQAIGLTGVFVLVPSAITLDHLAQRGEFDLAFGIVQTIELLAGTTNLTLLLLNMRDGFALGAKRRARSRNARATSTA